MALSSPTSVLNGRVMPSGRLELGAGWPGVYQGEPVAQLLAGAGQAAFQSPQRDASDLSRFFTAPDKGGGERPAKTSDDETAIVDQTLGQLLDAVARLGLGTNTYIIYTTDHGTPGRNTPLTGGKGTVWEGGLRVPFILAGPGVKAGACSHVRVTQTDLFPTFAELVGAKETLPRGIEGGSFAGVLKNGGMGEVKRPREEFVVHFPHYDKDAQGPASAIYLGDLKLIRVYETGALKLFDLAS